MRFLDAHSISRRSVLGSGTAFLALPLMSTLGSAAAVPADDLTRFVVDRNGSPFGSHVLKFRQEGEDLHVRVEIDFEVGLGPITFFRYSHRNDEVWRDGRLISLQSTTNDDGKAYRVSARAESDKLLVDGSSGQFELPGETLSTSYWHERTVSRSEWLDSQKGRLMKATVSPLGKEPITAGGQTIEASRYRFQGELDCDLWYYRERWVKLFFEIKQSEIAYRLQSPVQTTG
jgi:hypothetical protein